MTTISRAIRNLLEIGPRQFGRQLMYLGDNKTGTLVGTDRYGNKYYENQTELPLRTRWVDYTDHEFNPDQIEPGWHAWMSHMVDAAPSKDALLTPGKFVWEPQTHKPVATLGRSTFRTYSTTKSKITAWTPVAAARANAG